MAQVIDQYAIRIGFQLNSAQMAAAQRAIQGVVGGVNRVLPAVNRGMNSIVTTSRQSLIALDAAVARTSKLGMDLTTRLSLPLAALSGYGIKAAAEIEKAQITLNAMIGNADRAKLVQKELSEYAIKSSFNIQNVMAAASKMITTGAATPENVMDRIKLLGAAAMGDNERFGRIAYAVSQIESAKRLLGPEQRQLSESLVNVLPILEKMKGLKEGSLAGNIGDAGITSKELLKALEIMVKTGPQMRVMEAMEKSLWVRLAGIAERFYLFAGAIGEALRQAVGLDKFLDNIAETMGRVQKRIERMTDSQKKLLVTIGLFLIAVGPMTYALSVFLRIGATLLRTVGGLKAALMGLTAVSKGGGILTMLLGSAGAKALLIVAAVAAILGALFLVVDDILVWKDGGKSIFGFLFGEKKDWEWVLPLLEALREVLSLATKVAAYGVVSASNVAKKVLPSVQEVRESGGLVPHMLKGAKDFLLPEWNTPPAWGMLSRALPFAPPERRIKIQVPFTAISSQTREDLARLGVLNAPQNRYVREFDLLQAGAAAEVD